MLRDRYPRLGVVLVLPEPDAARVAAAAQHGASGAVPRSASVATLISVIRSAASEPETFRAPGELLRAPARPGPRLSPRERQVLALLVEGRTQAQIAEALQISPATAKTHVARLYTKLQARNRSQALLTVAREGSFSRAAQKLFRTQPAVSQAIRRLEQELGEPLFDRSSRDGMMTDAGRALTDYAAAAITIESSKQPKPTSSPILAGQF